MSKIKIAISSIFYPLFMGKYIIDAFKRRDDVEVFTVGPYTGNWIPWSGGITLDNRYAQPPNFPLGRNLIGTKPHPAPLDPILPWKPDLFLMIDAGFHFRERPTGDMVVLVETDPHALYDHYTYPRKYVDAVFSMQTPYMRSGDFYLPYAFDENIFYPQELEKTHDVTMVGLQYGHRANLVNVLRSSGVNVYFDIGIVYDEFREVYNHGKVAVSWSSLKDLPARVWEAMGMRLPLVSNWTPDMDNFFVDGEHYLKFTSQAEAVEKVRWCLDNPDDADTLASNAYRKVIAGHTWDHRVSQILEQLKLV